MGPLHLLLGAALLGAAATFPVTDHFDGTRFHNEIADPRGEADLGDLLRWARHRQPGPWAKVEDAVPGPKPPTRVGPGALRVTFVGHATMLVQMDGVNLLTDPIWSERASPVGFAGPARVRPPGIRFEDLPPIDVVLVSHNHYDHLDLPTLKRLEARFHPRFVVPLGNAGILAGAGLKATGLDWWQSVEVAPGVEVFGVPAKHFSNRMPWDRNRALWGGYVVRGPAGAAYFAGDTAFGPHFAEIRARFGRVRLAMLPIGAFRPEWFMGRVHLSPADAVRAHYVLEAKTSVAIHFGTFRLADDGQLEAPARIQAAVEAAREAGGTLRFWTLGFGEGRDVPPDPDGS